jgi:hypothetical protein
VSAPIRLGLTMWAGCFRSAAHAFVQRLPRLVSREARASRIAMRMIAAELSRPVSFCSFARISRSSSVNRIVVAGRSLGMASRICMSPRLHRVKPRTLSHRSSFRFGLFANGTPPTLADFASSVSRSSRVRATLAKWSSAHACSGFRGRDLIGSTPSAAACRPPASRRTGPRR